jgi:hypothetical protein
VAYLDTAQVQAWLNEYKYTLVGDPDPQLVQTAVDIVLGRVAYRYDTSTWVDDATTPNLALDIMAMLVAAYTLRRAVSEDDGIATYSNWLERRADKLLDDIVNGTLDLPGVPIDDTAPAALGPAFYPDDASTGLWEDDHNAEGGAARWFTMQQVF